MIYDINGNEINVGGESHGESRPVSQKNINLFDPTNYTIGVVTASGFNPAQTSCIATDFIPVHPGQIVSAGYIKTQKHNPFYISAFTQKVYGISFFADKQSNRTSAVNASDNGVAVPSGANFIRVSFMPDGYYYPVQTPEIFFVCVADAVTDNPHPYGITVDEWVCDHTPFYNKTWVMFGDSIFDSWGGHYWDAADITAAMQGGSDTSKNTPWSGKLFASRIASELGLKMDNRAKAGSNMCSETNTNYASVNGIIMLDAFLAEIEAETTEQPALITIAFGTNAYAEQCAREDPNALNDYRGATKYFIQKLREKCPNSVFGFILPYDNAGVHGTPGIGRAAIKSVLDAYPYQVPYVDLYTESGITVDLLPDGVHPGSYQANNLVYHAIRRFVMGL